MVRGYYSLSQTKKQVLDLALENYIAYLNSRNIKKLFGKVKWEGDMKEIRKA